jgi:hypothetical protein
MVLVVTRLAIPFNTDEGLPVVTMMPLEFVLRNLLPTALTASWFLDCPSSHGLLKFALSRVPQPQLVDLSWACKEGGCAEAHAFKCSR